MPWDIAVTDLANGNGARVVVTTPGATTYYVQRAVVAPDAAGSFVSVNSSAYTGDTTTTFAGLDYYRWRVIQGSNSAVLAPTTTPNYIYQPATIEGDSVHERCLVMVKDRIDGLELTTAEGAAVECYVRQMAEESNISYPCFLLAIAGLAEEVGTGTNLQEDYGYQVVVQICERCKADADYHRARHLMWRNKMIARLIGGRYDLRNQSVYMTTLKPGPVIDIPQSEKQADYRVGLFTLTHWSRELRNAA